MVKSHPIGSVVLVILISRLSFGQEMHDDVSLDMDTEVMTLTDSNFASSLAEVGLALVKFFKPGCGHCQQLAPVFDKAAFMLKDNIPPIILAQVDCSSDGMMTCAEHGVDRYPVLTVFKRGQAAFQYDGPRESDAIVSFMKSKLGPSSKELKTVEDVDAFLDFTELMIIGFFEDENSELNQNFQQLADFIGNRIRFGHTFSAGVRTKYSYKNQIVLFREPRFQSKMEPPQVIFKGIDHTLSSLKDWVFANINSLVGHRTMRNMDEFKKPLVVIYYDVDYLRNTKGTNYWRNRIVKIARKCADAEKNVSFVISNVREFSEELSSLGLTKDKVPVVAAWNLANEKFKMTEEFSIENLEKFVNLFLEGGIKLYLKSEPVPESNDDPVKVVVAETFKEMVNDVTKDVLIEFYSPMCGHCMVLAPKYEKLAIKLKDESDLVIAKMDATANEVPEIYELQGFPSIFFVPKGSKDSPISYSGEREVEDFVKFLAKEATSPLKGFSRNGKSLKIRKKKTSTENDKEL